LMIFINLTSRIKRGRKCTYFFHSVTRTIKTD
jgi:hypothetical protein